MGKLVTVAVMVIGSSTYTGDAGVTVAVTVTDSLPVVNATPLGELEADCGAVPP